MLVPRTLHIRAVALFAVGSLALLFAACGGSDGNGGEPTAVTTAASTIDNTGDDTGRQSNELGEAPIFYAPLDGFESLRAGEPYKVLFRITNGYAEETLRIAATHDATGETVEFEALRAEPVGEDDRPGTFYPVNLDLPEAGTWQVTILAGEADASFSVEVAPATSTAPSRRY